MSTTIDERVVEMRFDNRNFESNVQTSLSTIEKLKQKLNFTGASKGLDEINKAAGRTDLSGISSAVETIHAKFSALQIMGATALANITNSAVNAGKRITKALTIDPIKTGFQEYETQINAVQTILANTKSKGTTLDDVNGALDELNRYADKTIYNFTEMTRNIGTFTAAGVDLDTSVSSIQGIANLAAVSGSTSQQASTAMYQLSQALAAGKVSLMDWNSVVNAGMGGQVFQDALKRTSEVMGTGAEDAIKKYGSFRESLTQGEWLTTDVLTKTLEQFTMAAEKGTKQWDEYKKSLMEEGYTAKQAEEILEMANTATDAATKVKTFTQLWDVLKEAAQSGWTQTWEIIIGDFEQAKSLLTSVSDVATELINNFSESRNKLLQGWKDLGGRTDLIEGFKNIFKGFSGIIKPIAEAFREIIPPTTAEQLYKFTKGFKELTENFKISDKTADKLKRTFKGLFSIVSIFRKILATAAKAVGDLFGSGAVSGVLDLILSATAAIGDVFTSLNNGFDLSGVSKLFSGIADVIAGAINGLTGFDDTLSGVGKVVSDVVGGIWNAFKTAFTWIKDNVSIGDVFAGLAGGGIFLAGKKIAGLFDSLGGLADKGLMGLIFGDGDDNGQVTKFRDVLGSVSESLGAFTNGIKVGSLLAIAGSIAILSGALKNVSELKVGDVAKSLLAIGIMFKMMTTSFKSINSSLEVFAGKGIIKSGIAMMIMAKSIGVLADAMKEMSDLSLKEIAKGLVGIGGGIAALSMGLKAINGVKIKVSTVLAIGVLASAMKNMSKSLIELGQMSWGDIGRGLSAMGGALGEFMITLKILDKVGGMKSLAGSLSLVIAVESLDEIGEALSNLGGLSWSEIGHGLTAMGGALGELALVSGTLGKLTGFSGVLGSVALVEGSKSLGDIATALSDLSIFSWDEISRGLAAMGGALGELGLVSGTLGKLAGFSGLLGAGALVLAVQSLGELADGFQKFTGFSWEEIKMGLAGMGGALVEVGGVSGALGKISGFSGIIGSGVILLTVQGLGDIANALKSFGSMTWDEIKHGLVGMGGALAEIAIISGTLGTFGGLGALVGSGSILLAVQGLGDIADALKKFGEMSWDEIGRGLTAMGAALGEIALGGLLNTLSIIGSISIGNVAEPLGVLADSVKKWTGVVVPENLGLQLGLLAHGVKAFTFGGLGASAISEVAAPLGTLAGSVKKWTGVVVPENLGANLKALAQGVKSFTFGGLGASAISEVAAPLGTLAGSVKKWTGVTVPDTLNGQLTGLAKGVKSFSFAFMGGWSISAIAEPLGKLAGSIKKWNGVVVPEGLKTQLSGLAKGVKSFSFAFLGGWSLSALTGPLGKLATSVKKWNGVTVPDDLGKKLKSLAKGVKAFSGLGNFVGAKSINSLASAVKNISGVNFGTIATEMNKFTNSMKKLGDSGSSISGLGKKISSNISKPITDLAPKLKTAGTKMVNSLSSGIKSNNSAKNAASKMASAIKKAYSSKSEDFKSAGTKIATSLSKGIDSKKSSIKTASTAGVKSGIKAVRGYKDNFYNAGAYIAQGLASGMKSKNTEIQNAANEMAAAAEKATRAKLKINSPSKVFMKIASSIPEGFAMGITKMRDRIKDSTSSMADTATNTAKNTLSNLSNLVNSRMDTQPTIRPIMDLSDVRTGAGAIESMLGFDSSIGVSSNIGAISSMMRGRNQNGNEEVVSAINKLRNQLGNVGNSTYNINGISYSDGDVTTAIETLVRAARIERRV